jgi:hypothetical protein
VKDVVVVLDVKVDGLIIKTLVSEGYDGWE